MFTLDGHLLFNIIPINESVETPAGFYRVLYYGMLSYAAIMGGGIATTILLLAIALFILLGWSVFFVQFHELLFPPGTWTFAYSDSLIRLFPEKFWFDLGVIMSLLPLAAGIVVAGLGYFLSKSAAGGNA